MMKKVLSLLCVSGLLIAVLGCGPQAEQSKKDGTPESAPSGAASVANMVQDPSLENGAEGWGGESIEHSSDAACAHTGKFGLLVTTNAKNPWGGATYGEERYNLVDGKTMPVEPNSEYVAAVWVKGIENFEGVQVQFHAMGTNRTSLGSSKVQLSGEWQQVTLRFKAKAHVNHVGFNIVKVNSPATAKFAIDDLEVNPVAK